jgi:DNA repair exonuclease SbcCD nuclease subunit
MKFLHVGDTHIGRVYKDEQRNADVRAAFVQVVDYAIKENVDMVVHSGDLFNEGIPALSDLLFVTDQLKRLKDSGIRIFIVPGSHDVGMGESDSIIELFDRNGLLTNLNSTRYIEEQDGKVILSGELYRNVFLTGVRGKRSRVEDEIFKRLSIVRPDGAWVYVFVFHHTISDLGLQFKDLDTSSLPLGFDYYAAGHWHGNKDNIPYGKGVIQYPGSLEYCDESEIVSNPNRGFYVVNYDANGINAIERVIIKTRGKDVVSIDASKKSAKDIYDEVGSKLSRNDGKLLVVKLEGEMENRGELNSESIKDKARTLGYSYVSVNVSKLFDVRQKKVEIKSKDLDSVENELLEGKGYNSNEIAIAKFMISCAQEKMGVDEMRKGIEKIYGQL